jgi:hypothetical protein
MSKVERAQKANELIETIASHGRQFFNHRHGVSRFEVDSRGRIWFWDGYTAVRIYVAYKHWSKGFTQGGTLRDLICALRDYIRTGQSIHSEHFGPWWYCNNDLWGYGDAMEAVRAKALELGIVEQVAEGAR